MPDLFTTDWNHCYVGGPEILRRLLVKRVTCPVFVISACAPNWIELKPFLDAGLNVALLAKPFSVKDLRDLLSLHFNVPELPKS